MYQAGDNLASDTQTLKEAIKLLGNKIDAIVKATMAGEDLNDEVLSRIMVENNVTELKSESFSIGCNRHFGAIRRTVGRKELRNRSRSR